MKIGEFLQKYIDENNISQAELARRSGVPASTISSIINRNNDRVAIEMILKLCEVLNCDINEYINTLKNNTLNDISETVFTQKEIQHIKKYRTLDEYGKEVVDSVLGIEYRRCSDNNRQGILITGNSKKAIARSSERAYIDIPDEETEKHFEVIKPDPNF